MKANEMRMCESERKQREEINAAREVLNPTPIELHHIPNWLRQRMLKVFGCPAGGYASGLAVLDHARCQYIDRTGWLDHYGSTTWEGEACFVTEPYGPRAEMLTEARHFAEALGIKHEVSTNSWWYPGRTIRFLFWEPKERSQEQRA